MTELLPKRIVRSDKLPPDVPMVTVYRGSGRYKNSLLYKCNLCGSVLTTAPNYDKHFIYAHCPSLRYKIELRRAIMKLQIVIGTEVIKPMRKLFRMFWND